MSEYFFLFLAVAVALVFFSDGLITTVTTGKFWCFWNDMWLR
jgi:hypothetical protein